MAATVQLCQDTGAETGSPLKGTTRTVGITTGIVYKNIDDATSTSMMSSIPFPASGTAYSFNCFHFLKFTGTFYEISAVKVAHTQGTLPTGYTMRGKVTSTYDTPSAFIGIEQSIGGTTDISSTTAIASGMDMRLSTTGPEDGTLSNRATTTCYTQYFLSQLYVNSATAAPNALTSTYITFGWTEY